MTLLLPNGWSQVAMKDVLLCINASAEGLNTSTNLCLKLTLCGETSATFISALLVRVAERDVRPIARNTEFHLVSFGTIKPIPRFSSTESEAFGLHLTPFHRADACVKTALDIVL